MIESLIAEARQRDAALAARKAAQRQEWYTFRTIDRLEKALRVARGRLPTIPAIAG